MKTTVLKCNYKFSEYPVLTDLHKKTDNNVQERESLIIHALNAYSFLIPNYTTFRLCYLGQKIKEYTSDKRSHFIADILIINSLYYSPFYKSFDIIKQL